MGKTVNFSSNFGPKKCAKKSLVNVEGKDRISELPDEILVSLLSLLPLKEAARTSVLSKRWTNLWTFRSHLDLCGDKLEKNIERRETFWQKTGKYVGWVNHVLLKSHKSISRLDLFRIVFPLTDCSQKDIDDWIKFALNRSVHNLELDLLHWGRSNRYGKPYVFPDISHCLDDHSYVFFRSLKVLCFKNVSVTDQVLQFILHNCPFLEELTVHHSHVLVSLEVSGPSLSLKHLEVCYCFKMESIFISNSNLVSLKVMNAGYLRLEKVPALIHVNVGHAERQFWVDVLPQLSCCFSQLSRLTLVINDTKLKLLDRNEFPQLTKLNELVFVVDLMFNKSMLGCTRLIRAAPFLKRVAFKIIFSYVTRDNELRKARRYPIPNLEVVEICGYSSTSSELQLVNYFLENATALKKIIIDPRMHDYSYSVGDEDEDESTLRLLAKQQLEGVVVPPHVELEVL